MTLSIWIGLVLSGTGWVLVVWGISRKATSRAKVRSVADSLKAVAVRARSQLRAKRQRLARHWQNIKNRIHYEGQRIKERVFKRPKTSHPTVTDAVGIKDTVEPVLTRGPPTAEGNQNRIERIEERLRSAEEESLFADGLVVIGGFLAVMGTIVLAVA